MRYSEIKISTKRMLTRAEAGNYVGLPALLGRMENAGWIRPAVTRPKMRLYDLKKLDLCCDRLAAGEFPE